MSARHFVLWASGERAHLASRSAYERGEAAWRADDARVVPWELVQALGWEEWQTPANGPFPAFSADRLSQIVQWLLEHGYTARIVEEPR